jgi:hypothetical protein
MAVKFNCLQNAKLLGFGWNSCNIKTNFKFSMYLNEEEIIHEQILILEDPIDVESTEKFYYIEFKS